MAQPQLVADNQFKIEKGVPLPPGTHGNAKYPFPKMEIGDSVVIPAVARSAARVWGQRHDRKFMSRAERPGFVRVWRTA